MTEIDFAYFNYEHGGLIGGHDHAYSSGRGFDFAGLVRMAGPGEEAPHAGVVVVAGGAAAVSSSSSELTGVSGGIGSAQTEQRFNALCLLARLLPNRMVGLVDRWF